MTIQEYMTANRQEVIDMINDEVQFTKTNLKEVSMVMVKSDDLFQAALLTAKADNYFSAEYKAFKELMTTTVATLVLQKVSDNDSDWASIEASIKRQMKAAF